MTNQAVMTQLNDSEGMVNGIHIETLMATVKAVEGSPDLGQCKFRARNTWLGGSRNCTSVSGFYGAGQEFEHKQTFKLYADEPQILAGNDEGANPVEHLLNALAGCVTTSMVAHAAVRGINIEALECELEGDIDLRGFLGLADDVPKGFTDIRINFKVTSDVGDLKTLKELASYSPVFNTLMQGVNVAIELQKK